MLPRVTLLKPAIITRRLFTLVVRAIVVTTMSFGIAFGFLSGTLSRGAAATIRTLLRSASPLCSAPHAAPWDS